MKDDKTLYKVIYGLRRKNWNGDIVVFHYGTHWIDRDFFQPGERLLFLNSLARPNCALLTCNSANKKDWSIVFMFGDITRDDVSLVMAI